MRRHVGYGMIQQRENRSSCFPDVRHLLELSLFMRIFPGSDMKHPFVNPCYLTVGQILSSVTVTSRRDVVAGLMLCDSVISYIADSRRYQSELIGFLSRLYECASSSNDGEQLRQFSVTSFKPSWSLIQPSKVYGAFDLRDMWGDFDCDAEFSGRTFETFCAVMEKATAAYQSLPSFVDIVSLFPGIVDVLDRSGFDCAAKLSASITERLLTQKAARKHLKRIIRPKMIKQLDPKFDENFVPGKDLDPDRSKADLRKLKRKLKSETKGARRELRRDAAYIEQERRRQLAQQEAVRDAKRKEVMTFLQEQQRDSNLLSKVSKKKQRKK
jgi:nucleolar protein 14